MRSYKEIIDVLTEKGNHPIDESLGQSVGVWWLYNGDIIEWSYSLDDAKIQSVHFKVSPKDHHDLWPQMQRKYPELRNKKYTDIPRGRVVMDLAGKSMEVWGSPDLLHNDQIRSRIIELYGLQRSTKWITDDADILSHYTGAQGPSKDEEKKQLKLFFNRSNKI